jgi:hypothetical protein
MAEGEMTRWRLGLSGRAYFAILLQIPHKRVYVLNTPIVQGIFLTVVVLSIILQTAFARKLPRHGRIHRPREQ